MSGAWGFFVFAVWSVLCYVLGALGVFHGDGGR